MKVARQRYRRVAVADLKPHPKNPRRGDIGAIRESIQRNDFYGAVIVQRSTGYVLAGHHKLAAADAEGASDVPVLEVDVDDATALRMLLADNRTSDRAGYEDDVLLEVLREIGDEAQTLEGTGWSFDDFQTLERQLARLAERPESPPVESGHAEYTCPSCGHTWAGARKP